ncbi:10582_t:CDS:2, partial [Cetraspora pellucida]
KKCIDQDPQKRPTANEIYLRLDHLWSYIYYSKKLDKLHIKEKFMAADKIIKTLPDIIRHHPDSMYTSRIIITKELFKDQPKKTYSNNLLSEEFKSVNLD